VPELPVTKPELGQQTEKQPSGWGGRAYRCGIGPLTGVAGTATATTGAVGAWPYWSSLLWGSYGTYRAMMNHATIAFTVSQVLGPLLGSDWVVDADEDAPKDAVEWVKENVIAHRSQVIVHALRSVILGNAPFEVVWAREASRFVIDEFVPLLPDITQVLRADNGNGPINGLQNGEAKLAPAEFLYVLNDSDVMGAEPGDDYGRSRLENIRDTAWPGWIDSALRLAELEDRVSGVVPYGIVPPGSPPGAAISTVTGAPKSYAELLAEALPDLVNPRSKGIVAETPAAAVDYAIDSNPGAAKMLTTEIKTLDFGNRGASQGQLLEKLKYWDNMIGRGLYRGERTLFATQGGTKADAGEHDKNAEPDQEAIDNMIARQINCQPCRVGLVLNYGEKILKKVRGIKPAPLVDKERVAARDTIDKLLASPQIGPEILPYLDGDKMFEQAGVAHVGSWADFIAKMSAKREAAQPPAPNGNAQPGVNGNGKTPDRMKQLGNRLAKRLQQ
jgi:hypothetical protein